MKFCRACKISSEHSDEHVYLLDVKKVEAPLAEAIPTAKNGGRA